MIRCRTPGTTRHIARRTGVQLAAGVGLWAFHAACLPRTGAGFPGAVICSTGGRLPGAVAASPFAAAATMNMAMAVVMLLPAAAMAADEPGQPRPSLPSLVGFVLAWAAWALGCAAFAVWPAGPASDRIRAVTVALLLVAPMVRVVPRAGGHGRDRDADRCVVSDRPSGRSRRPAWTDAAGLRVNGPCMTVMALAGMSLPLMAGASLAMATCAVRPRSPASRVLETLALTAGLGLALL